MGRRRGDFAFTATLDDREVTAALRRISASLNDLAQEGEEAFSRVQSSGTSSSVAIGTIQGVVSSLTTSFLSLAREAVGAFQEIARESTQVSIAADSVKASLVGIFQGNEEAATAAFDRIRRESLRLGVDLTELAPAFLPKVEDLDQFTRIGELVSSLARLDPAQGAQGARLALTEALSGDLGSLRRRFEIDVTPIQEAQKEFGDLEGLLVGLEEVLKSRGQDFETLGETTSAALGRIDEVQTELKLSLGEPISDQLNESLSRLYEMLTDELPDGTRKVKDEFVLLAGAIGDVLALLVELSTDLLGVSKSIDVDRITAFVTSLGEVVLLIKEFNAVAQSIVFPIFPSGEVEGFGRKLWDLTDALKAAVQLSIVYKTVTEGLTNARVWEKLLSGEVQSFEDFVQAVDEATSGQISRLIDGYDQTINRIDRLNQSTEDRREALAEDLRLNEALADSLLSTAEAFDEEAKAAEDAAEAVKKAQKEFDISRSRELEDLQIKQARARIEFDIDASNQRSAILRKTQTALSETERSFAGKRLQLLRESSREELQLQLDTARKLIDLDREKAQEEQQIELDHRKELRRILTSFTDSAQDAIRQQDAIAFVSAKRRMEQEKKTAEETRRSRLEETQRTYSQQREEIQEQLRRSLEDSKEATRARLEDLQTALQQELSAIRSKQAQELQSLEETLTAKRQLMLQQQIWEQQDFQRTWSRRLSDLNRQYAQEYALSRMWETKIASLRQAIRSRSTLSRRSTTSTKSRGMGSTFTGKGGEKTSGSLLSSLLSVFPGRRSGGPVSPGITYIVGEQGPELVKFPVPGEVFPQVAPVESTVPGTQQPAISNSQQVFVDLQIPAPNRLTNKELDEIRQVVFDLIQGAVR